MFYLIITLRIATCHAVYGATNAVSAADADSIDSLSFGNGVSLSTENPLSAFKTALGGCRQRARRVPWDDGASLGSVRSTSDTQTVSSVHPLHPVNRGVFATPLSS